MPDKYAESKTMAIFTKLLATKIVANKRFLLRKSFWIKSILGAFWSLAVSISFFLSEKNATSDPDMSADKIRRTTKPKMPRRTEVVEEFWVKNNMLDGGSGSKFKNFVQHYLKWQVV